jgi:hypothetical protein
MLVDDKFIFLSIPRTASTSFHISCNRSGINVKDINNTQTTEHKHERLNDLNIKFGNEYEIIAIKRNRYERFISLWKHIIDLSEINYSTELSDRFKTLKLNDILFFKNLDLISNKSQYDIIYQFSKKNGVQPYFDEFMKNILLILFRPTSFWHHNDHRIQWFDFGNFTELEEWVSIKTGKPFKMENSNGSNSVECELKLNDDFIERYNSIYDYYDLHKDEKTLI